MHTGVTMSRRVSWFIAPALVSALACSSAPPPPAAAANEPTAPSAQALEHTHLHDDAHEACGAESGARASALVRITDPANTCMLSNRYLGEKQNVPVTVGDKTYFGCCANCAARIGGHEEARTATDPVSGHVVDK